MNPLRYLAVSCAVALSIGAAPQDYRRLAGQHQRVCGTVVEVSALSKNCDVALYIGNSADRIAAVIPQSVRSKLPKRPEEYLQDELCVSGAVTERQKHAIIEVTAPDQIETSRSSAFPFAPGVARACDAGAVLPQSIKEVAPRLPAGVL